MYPVVKRALDILGACLLLLVAFPILSGALLAVWLDSGRPLLYRRRVTGLGGCEFDALKIRTMVRNADDLLRSDHVLRRKFAQSNKLQADPRVTRSGRWLRRFSLDEVPQLFNVLTGEMSLVGPRIITADELTEWGETAQLMVRVRPGLTGLWQVSGRQELGKSDRVRLDGDYVRRMSLWLDIAILARTLPAVLYGRGAY